MADQPGCVPAVSTVPAQTMCAPHLDARCAPRKSEGMGCCESGGGGCEHALVAGSDRRIVHGRPIGESVASLARFCSLCASQIDLVGRGLHHAQIDLRNVCNPDYIAHRDHQDALWSQLPKFRTSLRALRSLSQTFSRGTCVLFDPPARNSRTLVCRVCVLASLPGLFMRTDLLRSLYGAHWCSPRASPDVVQCN